jgi:hypothetical protein
VVVEVEVEVEEKGREGYDSEKHSGHVQHAIVWPL